MRITSIIILLFIFTLSGCKSVPIKEVYDQTVPVNEQSILIVGKNTTVTSFNGNIVKWPEGSELTIPAGKHKINFSYHELGKELSFDLKVFDSIRTIGEVDFNFTAGRIYEFTVYGYNGYLVFENTDIMPFADLNNETVMVIKNNGRTPMYAHIRGYGNTLGREYSFYLNKSSQKSIVIPYGNYYLKISKNDRSWADKEASLNFEANNDRILIEFNKLNVNLVETGG